MAALGFGFLGLIATGGDSAFAQCSGWIYTPFLVALGFTAPALAVTAAGASRPAVVLVTGAALGYLATVIVWGGVGPWVADCLE